MCGILAIWDRSREIDPDLLAGLRDIMSHRGPDGAGQWISTDRSVGLAHRRLAIVDLSESATQPMELKRYGVVISFNGEIYNHAKLRLELESLGYVFITDHSDTEILGIGYRAWGMEGLLNRINGMFAFVIYDVERKTLIAARDRVGIKPLYLHRSKSLTLLASELKAIVAHPDVTAALDEENFSHHLVFRALPAPRTLFRGVEKVPPGHWLEVSNASNEMVLKKYWDPLDNYGEDYYPSRDQAVDCLATLMQDSTAMRVGADVPVGTFLSGGVDSGLILRLAVRAKKEHSAFTIHYAGQDRYNESLAAKLAAEECGADFFEVNVTGDEFRDVLPEIAYFQDEPISAPVCASVYFLAREARKQGVPVVLAGEGADELFAGYQRWSRLYRVQRYGGKASKLPGFQSIASAIGKIGPKNSKLMEALRRLSDNRPVFWGGAMDFTPLARDALLGISDGKYADTYEAIIEPFWNAYKTHGDADDILGWMNYLDIKFRLPELMLMRLDKMTMAHGIEGRVPFLDHRVVDYAFGLSRELREQSVREPKKLVKQVAERFVPNDIVYAQKIGFRAPVKEWKHETFDRGSEELLSFTESTGIYDPKAIRSLLSTKGDRLYFSLLNIYFWHRAFLSGTG